VIFAVSLPFRGDQGFFWVVGRFLNSAGGYDYASVEAYNFLALCGGNWKSAELSLVPGIPYKAFGMVMIVLAVVLSVAMQVVSRRREGGETLRARPERLLIPAAFCMFMIFTFGHYMHERYVFPVMALLAFAYAATRDKRLLVSSMLLSVVLALNETTAMYVVSNAASAAVRGTQQHQIVIGVCSLFEVLTFFYTAKVCLERGFGQKDRR
jgi:dolichyl-phosphate-mannose-protein mannosyltransferase